MPPAPATIPGSSARTHDLGRTEFEILRDAHQFLRDDEREAGTWDDQLAKKYYDALWKEFAVCDLKHYKSGNFALRWRTESEVLSGAGERSCGNTRCTSHLPPRGDDDDARVLGLATLELPFAYEEHGTTKSALVKVVLCAKCVKKMLWKRTQEKECAQAEEKASQARRAEGSEDKTRRERKARKDGDDDAEEHSRRADRTRSRSPLPRKRDADGAHTRRRSP